MKSPTNRYEFRRFAAIALAAVLVAIPTAHTAYAGEPAQLLTQTIDVFRPALRPVAAPCSLHNNNGTAMAFLSTIHAGDRFASYLNPANCQGTEDYPMAIYWVSLPLYHFPGARWPVGAKVQLYSAAGADSCAGPGELLYSYSCLLDSATFAAPHVGVITLPDPVCVTGPFYVVFEYDGSTPQPYPSVLFDTQFPADPCLNWVYRSGWVPWNVFWLPPGAGNFMIWVDGYSNSTVCGTDEPVIQSISSLYNNFASLVGSRVTTMGYYTDSSDAKLVADYGNYLANTPLPPYSALALVGPRPDSSFDGDLIEVTGYLYARRNPFPYYVNDTVTLVLYPSKWTGLIGAPLYPGSAPDTIVGYAPEPDTNGCVFGLIIGGGVNELNEHARYWNELSKAYRFLVNQAQSLPVNVMALYGTGMSRDTNGIPQARLDSLTVGKVLSKFAVLSQRIALCTRGHQRTEAHIYICGQGSAPGALTLAGLPLSAGQLRAGIQSLIDSGCSDLYLDLTGAFAGPLAESLKTLDDKEFTLINISSASGTGLSYSSPLLSPYIRARIDSLAAGLWYPGLLPTAGYSYVAFLDSLSQSFGGVLDSARSWLLANPSGTVSDSLRGKIVADSLAMTTRRAQLLAMLGTTAGRPRLWRRLQHSEYGTWQPIAVSPNGQTAVEFEGDTLYSGDVTVYKDTLISSVWKYKKAAFWRFTIPGSKGYLTGNNRRVISGDANRSTVFWLRNDSRRFTCTADLITDRPFAESGSNPYDGAGFSIGVYGNNNSFQELGTGTGAPQHFVFSPELPGVMLDTFPDPIGPQDIFVYYDIPSQNQFWTDMEMWVAIASVTLPGNLDVSVSGADNPNFTFSISSPGVYKFHLGGISGIGQHTVQFHPTIGRFGMDSWALRSGIADPPTCCIGTTGNVNDVGIVDLSDLSMLVAYLTGGLYGFLCSEEANINGIGIVDLSDLSLLVNYMTGGGATLPSCP